MKQNEKRLLLHQPDVTGGHDFEPLAGAQDRSGVGQTAVVEHGTLKERGQASGNWLTRQSHNPKVLGSIPTSAFNENLLLQNDQRQIEQV